MDEVIKIFRELQNSSGKRLQEILEENKDNQMLKDVLYFVYNPFIVTGLSNKKMEKDTSDIKVRGTRRFGNFLEETALLSDEDFAKALFTSENFDITCMFDYLIDHNTGRDKDIAYVQAYIKAQPEEYREIYKQIFTKELKLGITAKTINKVWKDFIPEFNVMLAEKYWDRMDELEKEKPDIIITQKYDGIRAVAKVRDGNVEIFSRQGKPIEGLKDIEEELKELKDGFYDGELLLDKEDIPSKDLYRETVQVVNSKNEYKNNIVFNIFDYIPLNDFVIGYSKMNCLDRKRFVYEELRKIEPDWLKPVEILYHGKYDKRIVQQELDKQIALEHEGVMVNLANAPYEGKRTKNILKVKAMQDCDLKIIGFEEGTGKNKGTLGAVIVDYKGFEVKVGSGFTDQDRDYFWNNQKKLLGRVITVQYFEETTNKKDNSLSLRFPVYLELREPGKEVSYY